jgi:hypothetical protein
MGGDRGRIGDRRLPALGTVAGPDRAAVPDPERIIEIESVDLVAADEIDDRDAHAAGYVSGAELVAELRGDPRSPVWMVRFHRVDEPDSRQLLSETAELTDSDVDQIEQRLARFDRASPNGAWTESALASIAESPAVRAGDLAAALGIERDVFKRNVRKLKELGLTWSLERGYRLSPRGEAYLTAKRGSEPA